MLEAPPAIIQSIEMPARNSEPQSDGQSLTSVQRRCEQREGEIVVCGRRGESPYRIGPIQSPVPEPGRDPLIPIGFNLGALGRVGPTIRQVTMPRGDVSRRVTATYRVRF